MYTLGLRPHSPQSKINQCINFEQESTQWKLARFQCDDTHHQEATRGLVVHCPLERIDITVEQLAIMLAGFETAYSDLCNTLYESASTDLRNSIYGDVKTFLSCIPESPYTQPPTLPGKWSGGNTHNLPFLHNPDMGVTLAWTGESWKVIDTPDLSKCSAAGECFGYIVYYDPTSMNTDAVSDPSKMAAMLYDLLGALSYLDDTSKIYVNSIFCVF